MKLSFFRKINSLVKMLHIIKRYKVFSKNNKKKYILFGTPIHRNLGDQAIMIAEQTFFKDNGITVFEVPFFKGTSLISSYVARHINVEDVILIHGGGFLGTQYFELESMVRDLIRKFPDNKIVIMPQTIFYKKDEFSQKEFENSKIVYNSHKNLYICAREKVSYEIMKKAYPNAKILLTPDIVFYLNKAKKEERNGILFAIRKDVEQKVSKEEMDEVIEIARKLDDTIIITDTVIEESFTIDERERVVQEKLEEFRKARLVITDRLHGMIFATITETPCIVFSNYNHKVKGVYDWIKDLNYISYLEDSQHIKEEMQRLLEMKDIEFNNDTLKKEYDKILESINI